MKKISGIIVVCLLTLQVGAQPRNPLSRFFDKYEPDTSFTIINISPQMFRMFSKVDLNTGDRQADQILDVAKKITGLRIITKSNAPNAMQLFREATGLLPQGYQELMTVRDHGDNLKFMVSQGPNGIIHHLVMLIGGGNEFFALSLTGNIDLNELSQIAGSMNIQGFDQLKNVR
jgi:hypothetical protein